MVDTALKIAAIIFLGVATIAIAAQLAPAVLGVAIVVGIIGGATLALAWIYRKWRWRGLATSGCLVAAVIGLGLWLEHRDEDAQVLTDADLDARSAAKAPRYLVLTEQEAKPVTFDDVVPKDENSVLGQDTLRVALRNRVELLVANQFASSWMERGLYARTECFDYLYMRYQRSNTSMPRSLYEARLRASLGF